MKKLKNKTIIICSVIVIAILIVIFIFIFALSQNSSKKLELSDFEKIAINGYLENYLSLDKLYLLAGISSYDELQYTRKYD